MNEINLEADGKTLKLTYEVQDRIVWCEVCFVKDGVSTMLAGDTIERILSKLVIGFMEVEDRIYFNYRGFEMYTIAVLQPHSVLAGRIDKSGELELVFLDTPGNIIPLMKLTTEDKLNWITQIFEHMKDFMLEHGS
ncbi:MAG: hypothetical protein NC413_12945 [Muribaculum sp.]|nr:hypothetical protein [Muribaculum sp.]